MTDLLSFKPELRHGSDNAAAGISVPDLAAELRAAVRHLNRLGIYRADEIARDFSVKRILADMAAAEQQARAAA